MIKKCLFISAFVVQILLVFSLQAVEQEEEFHEELVVTPLASGHVNTYFQFTTRWHYGAHKNLHNTRFMARPIADLLLETDIKELHISLTQGLWRYEYWGYPVEDAAPGAEAWAWFDTHNASETAIDEQWKRFANTFSGILCASINFIDHTNTIEPRYVFRPQFATGSKTDHTQKQVRYASLPREIVCTENLTPWKKLLPCVSREGFASLLNSGHVHNTNYHALSIKMRTICENPQNCVLEFTQTANLVYDPKLLGSTGDFSLRRFFGQGLNGNCALATTSKIYVNMEGEAKRYELNPPPTEFVKSTRGGSTTNFAVYDIKARTAAKEEKMFNIAWLLNKQDTALSISPLPPIYVHRYLLGHGQEKGHIITQLTNAHYKPLSVIVLENIPWFVPIYLHTLKITVTEVKNSNKIKVGDIIEPRILQYIPGVQRKRAYHLELALQIPAQSSIKISIDFDYIFLKWLEYPPDANHGHYLGSAIVSVQLPVARNYTAVPVEGYLFAHSFNASRAYYVQMLRTEALLLSLPTPDFSMPYNVICLACTVVALAFGPIHSVATKRIVIDELKENKGKFSLVRNLFKKITKRKTVTTTTTNEENLTSSEIEDKIK